MKLAVPPDAWIVGNMLPVAIKLHLLSDHSYVAGLSYFPIVAQLTFHEPVRFYCFHTRELTIRPVGDSDEDNFWGMISMRGITRTDLMPIEMEAGQKIFEAYDVLEKDGGNTPYYGPGEYNLKLQLEFKMFQKDGFSFEKLTAERRVQVLE